MSREHLAIKYAELKAEMDALREENARLVTRIQALEAAGDATVSDLSRQLNLSRSAVEQYQGQNAWLRERVAELERDYKFDHAQWEKAYGALLERLAQARQALDEDQWPQMAQLIREEFYHDTPNRETRLAKALLVNRFKAAGFAE